jgi:hypothetical protein
MVRVLRVDLPPIGSCGLRKLLIRHTGMGSAGILPLRVDKDKFQVRAAK